MQFKCHTQDTCKVCVCVCVCVLVTPSEELQLVYSTAPAKWK